MIMEVFILFLHLPGLALLTGISLPGELCSESHAEQLMHILQEHPSKVLHCKQWMFCKVIRPKITETTALGAAYLAGLAIGFWKDTAEIENYWEAEKNFEPQMKEEERQKIIIQWGKAIKAAQAWATD